jgi:hypothetical protein
MNPRPWPSLVLTLVSAVSIAGAARAGSDAETTEIMQQKLMRSQAVLRGIALQDFALIQTNAFQMVKLSQLGGWQARQTPEYELFTIEFRRRAEDLVKAAKSKNIDAATLAYTQLTFSCVSCHKFLRGDGAQRASLRSP